MHVEDDRDVDHCGEQNWLAHSLAPLLATKTWPEHGCLQESIIELNFASGERTEGNGRG